MRVSASSSSLWARRLVPVQRSTAWGSSWDQPGRRLGWWVLRTGLGISIPTLPTLPHRYDTLLSRQLTAMAHPQHNIYTYIPPALNRPAGILPNNSRFAPPSLASALQADIDHMGVCCQVVRWSPRQYTLQYCGAHRTITIDSPAAAALAQYMPPPPVEDLSKVGERRRRGRGGGGGVGHLLRKGQHDPSMTPA